MALLVSNWVFRGFRLERRSSSVLSQGCVLLGLMVGLEIKIGQHPADICSNYLKRRHCQNENDVGLLALLLKFFYTLGHASFDLDVRVRLLYKAPIVSKPGRSARYPQVGAATVVFICSEIKNKPKGSGHKSYCLKLVAATCDGWTCMSAVGAYGTGVNRWMYVCYWMIAYPQNSFAFVISASSSGSAPICAGIKRQVPVPMHSSSERRASLQSTATPSACLHVRAAA